MSFINLISTKVKKAFDGIRKPFVHVPPLLLLCEVMQRPGMSAIALTTAIIQRCEQAGIPTGNLPDGTPNYNNVFAKIVAEEVINEIHNNAVVEAVIPTNTIVITATGANAGGPVEVVGSNKGDSKSYGHIV